MIKRLTGFVLGYLAGLASSWYLLRKIRAHLTRLKPPAVATRVGESLSAVRGNMTAAVSEGRSAMHQREAELRAELAPTSSSSVR